MAHHHPLKYGEQYYKTLSQFVTRASQASSILPIDTLAIEVMDPAVQPSYYKMNSGFLFSALMPNLPSGIKLIAYLSVNKNDWGGGTNNWKNAIDWVKTANKNVQSGGLKFSGVLFDLEGPVSADPTTSQTIKNYLKGSGLTLAGFRSFKGFSSNLLGPKVYDHLYLEQYNIWTKSVCLPASYNSYVPQDSCKTPYTFIDAVSTPKAGVAYAPSQQQTIYNLALSQQYPATALWVGNPQNKILGSNMQFLLNQAWAGFLGDLSAFIKKGVVLTFSTESYSKVNDCINNLYGVTGTGSCGSIDAFGGNATQSWTVQEFTHFIQLLMAHYSPGLHSAQVAVYQYNMMPQSWVKTICPHCDL